MNKFERRTERFARAVERRTVLRGAAGGIFAAVTATLVAPAGRAYADAGHSCSQLPHNSSTTCNPPGPFCTSWSSSYCNGAACSGNCSYLRTYYPDACWCTKTYTCSTSYTCWYKCCDCNCPQGNCGCKQFYRSAGVLPPRGGRASEAAA